MNANPYLNDPEITREVLQNSEVTVCDDVVCSFEHGFDPNQICPMCDRKLGESVTMRLKIVGTDQTCLIHRSSCFHRISLGF